MDEFYRALLAALTGNGRDTNLHISVTDAESGEPIILLYSPANGQGRYWASDCRNPECPDREGCRRSRLLYNFRYLKANLEQAEVVDSPADVGMPVNTVPVEAGPVDPNYFRVADLISDMDELWPETKDGPSA